MTERAREGESRPTPRGSRATSVEFLFQPLQQLDSWLSALLAGAPLLVALGIALLLGLRHASDPDHLVAVTSLVAADGGDKRAAARIGVWWGAGHAGVLFALGLPLILLKSELPSWLGRGAESAIGLVILALALRLIVKWVRGDYLARAHYHAATRHRHLRRRGGSHRHLHVRSPGQALGIGALHGLAGTGAVVVLLLAALPGKLEAAAALAVFAPMTVISMVALTTLFAWALTRPMIEPIYRRVMIPALGVFGVLFGSWYAGFG